MPHITAFSRHPPIFPSTFPAHLTLSSTVGTANSVTSCAEVSQRLKGCRENSCTSTDMAHRPADSRLLSNLLQQEKEYPEQLSQLLESSNASLALFTAYAAASPPPGSHAIMSVAGSLAGVDEALKRYSSVGVDEWRGTMRGLNDAEEEVGNIMRDREILCVFFVFLSFFLFSSFFVSYILFSCFSESPG